MSDVQYIPIFKDSIPCEFEISIGESLFTFEVNYNAEGDFFTLDLYKNDEAIIYGEKLTSTVALFDVYVDERFPQKQLVPYDISDPTTRTGYSELGESVYLYVED